MKVCIYFSSENLLLLLTLLCFIVVLFDIKNTIEIKTKFYIKYNHNYNIQ